MFVISPFEISYSPFEVSIYLGDLFYGSELTDEWEAYRFVDILEAVDHRGMPWPN